MTTAIETVICPVCTVAVAPTREGGTRPRDHNNKTGASCPGSWQGYEMPACDRCGMDAHDPEGCGSPMYHPETWTEQVDGAAVLVGNAAAAGELVHVAGEQYQWLVRIPPEGPRRAPAHLGFRRGDGVRFYGMDAVRAFATNRPGPGGHRDGR